jgi:hypothetical protein
VRHFFPELNSWLDAFPDSRFDPMVTYDARFLLWWGLLTYLLRLSSRRNADYDLRDLELAVLANVNLLAQTDQTTLPVDKTLDHFLEHTDGVLPFAKLPQLCANRLLRMRAFDSSRLQGKAVAGIDGTGLCRFSKRHCALCLTQKHSDHTTTYYHPVCEVKLLTTAGLVPSMATEFIENPDPKAWEAMTQEERKQDCELKGFARLAPRLKAAFPQLQMVISGDSLYACGTVLSICRQHNWSYVLTFKPGRTPALWKEFQVLLELSPKQRMEHRLPDRTVRWYRWVEALDFQDTQGRLFKVNALLCEETSPDGQKTVFAWVTDLPLNSDTVIEVAEKGGRMRVKIENEGFNVQKNSGLNLEHPYSLNWEKAKAYYYLLQVGYLLFQLLEKGSLLLALAKEYGKKTVVALWGSQENLAQRLLESLRYCLWADPGGEPAAASRVRISFSSS